MNEEREPHDAGDVDRQVRDLERLIDRVTELLRALAPLRGRWQALDAAAAEYVAGADQHQTRPAPLARQRPTAQIPPASAPMPPRPAQQPARRPVQFVPAAAAPADGADDRETSGERPQTAPQSAATSPKPLTLTIASENGPLDLGRIYGALESVPGVVGLALITYARGQAALRLHTDRPAHELPLVDALRGVFETDVTATQTAADELSITVGG